MTSFDERQKSFEKKFVMDAELQFKVSAKRNRYLAEWVAIKMGKNDEEKAVRKAVRKIKNFSILNLKLILFKIKF